MTHTDFSLRRLVELVKVRFHAPQLMGVASFRAAAIMLGLGILIFTSCQPHSASETVPGWDKMQAEKQERTLQKEHTQKIDPNAPTFFPNQTNQK